MKILIDLTVSHLVEIDLQELKRTLGRKPTQKDLRAVAVDQIRSKSMEVVSLKQIDSWSDEQPVRRGIGSY